MEPDIGFDPMTLDHELSPNKLNHQGTPLLYFCDLYLNLFMFNHSESISYISLINDIQLRFLLRSEPKIIFF